MFKFLKDKSIVNKIIIINAVVSVCIIIFLVFNNFYIKYELNKRTSYNYKTLLTEFQNRFFVEVDRIKNLGTITLNTAEVTNVKRFPKNSTAQIENIRSLKNQLSFIATSFDYGTSMNIYLKNNGIVINENGNVDSEYFNVSSGNSSYFSSSEIIELEKLETGFYPFADSILYVNNTASDMSFYFTASKDTFISFLEASDKEDDGGFAIFFDEELIASSKNLPNSLDYKKIFQNGEDIYKNTDGKKYGIVTSNCEFYGKPLTFTYICNNNQYEKIANYVNTYTWLSVILFLFINFFAVAIQYITYIPIRKMALNFNSYENGKNEINVIQSAFEHLKKNNSAMQDVIERNERLYEGQALLKLMHGEKQGIDTKMLDKLSQKFPEYVALYVLMSSGFGSLEIFEEIISENYYIEKIFTDTKSKKYVVCCENRAKLAEFLLRMVKKFNAEKELIMGISEVYGDISMLNIAYTESSQVLYKCPVPELLNNSVLEYKNLEFKAKFSIPWEKEHEVINSVLKGDEEKITEFFEQYLFGKFEAMSYENFKRVYSHLMSILREVTDTNNIEMDYKIDDENISVENIHKYVSGCYLKVARCFKNTSRNSMYEAILEYVNSNTDKCLTVNSIAYSLKITPEYLSSYFKKMSGLNISTYISNAKIEKAKEILKGKKNIKISDVAQMVGFDSVNTFNRNFKKYTGETPSQFKQKFD